MQWIHSTYSSHTWTLPWLDYLEDHPSFPESYYTRGSLPHFFLLWIQSTVSLLQLLVSHPFFLLRLQFTVSLMGESTWKCRRKKSTSKSEIFMLKHERKQGNWTKEHIFGLIFLLLGTFLATLGLGQKCLFFENQISKNYLINLKKLN